MAFSFSARSSGNSDIEAALDEVLADATSLPGKPDVAFVFLSPHFFPSATHVIGEISERTGARHVLGCGGGGIIADRREMEDCPALSLLLARLPGAKICPFHVDDDDIGDGQATERFVEKIGVDPADDAGFVVLPDPFSVEIVRLIEQFNHAYPGAVLCGGLASGAQMPGGNVLLLDGAVHTSGVVGLSFAGSVRLRAVVSQGCRPVGRRFIVTRAEQNVIHELSGKPAIDGVRDVLQGLQGKDRQLAEHALFVGRVMREQKTEFHRGDFLIRNLMGIDRRTGAIAVGDHVRRGMTVQFQVRDGETAGEDLHENLQHYKVAQAGQPRGALLFSCLGRGEGMYGEPNRDVRSVDEVLGEVPKAGFFCNGEIGPIDGSNYVHGFTLSSCFFEER
ncbi:MAG: FIST C-terminal domain-containing protein [Planctomycetes bacterium]|nr:FIST C-terminal domain-containing protein [Planctomycetota bacterium]MBI3846570.1 FIST C-terminal domain-containing protein [Planctomycetota bacterium]